jgi:putative oxidoreductase
MEILLSLLKTNDEWVVAVARIALGVIFFAHGAQKVLGWYGGPGFTTSVQQMTTHGGLPKPIAVLVLFSLFFGGLGLIVGFFTRFAAAGILITMLGAASRHYPNGLFMNWMGEKKGHGFEYHLLAMALALVVIVQGAGPFSIDGAIYHHQVDNRAAIAQPIK